MGFFSSRQAEDNDVYQVTLGLGGGRHSGNDKSVVQVIRSRFVRSLLLVQCRAVTHARKKHFFSTCASNRFLPVFHFGGAFSTARGPKNEKLNNSHLPSHSWVACRQRRPYPITPILHMLRRRLIGVGKVS